MVAIVAAACLGHYEFREFAGVDEGQVVRDRPGHGPKGPDTAGLDLPQGPGTDVAHHDGVHAMAAEGRQRLALAVGVAQIRVSDGLQGTVFR